ncbi:hypothetical protein GCM10027259_46940 [Micromonospora palomenae]
MIVIAGSGVRSGRRAGVPDRIGAPAGRRRARVAAMDPVSRSPAVTLADEALLGLLAPFWQLVIAAVVLAVVVLSAARLARRGRSRMTTALLVTVAAIVGLTVIGVLVQG